MNKLKVNYILNYCLEHKKTLTPSRLLIIKTLLKYSKPRSAYDLQNEVNKYRKVKINISTIYRVLDFWINLGFIHKIYSINKFIVCIKPHEKHTHMLNYCIKCSKVIESCNHEMSLDIKKSTAKLNLSFNQVNTIEIPVVCQSCI